MTENAYPTRKGGSAKTRDVTIVNHLEMEYSTARDAVQRVRAMFLEVPGTRLSARDAARLAGLEASVCSYVLDTLADARFLKRGRDGTFTLE